MLARKRVEALRRHYEPGSVQIRCGAWSFTAHELAAASGYAFYISYATHDAQLYYVVRKEVPRSVLTGAPVDYIVNTAIIMMAMERALELCMES